MKGESSDEGAKKETRGPGGGKAAVAAQRMLIVVGRVKPREWHTHVKIVLLDKAFAAYAFPVTVEALAA